MPELERLGEAEALAGDANLLATVGEEAALVSPPLAVSLSTGRLAGSPGATQPCSQLLGVGLPYDSRLPDETGLLGAYAEGCWGGQLRAAPTFPLERDVGTQAQAGGLWLVLWQLLGWGWSGLHI